VNVLYDDLLGAGDAEHMSISNWFEWDVSDIYDHLNLRAKQGQMY
jgi:hypothetical protein